VRNVRANPLRCLILFLPLFLLAGCGSRPERAAGAPVILISIDTLRADRLPAYGHREGSTPAIDRLAADGILFESAWAHVPLTLPSHASLFTGLLPPANGVRSNLGYRLDPERGPTLASVLARHGYATGGAVSAYVLRHETGIGAGFERWDDAIDFSSEATLSELERPGEATVDAALAWLAGVGERPFFLFVHLFEPHFPYEPPSPFRERLADPYDGEIATADAAVGRLLDWLRTRGIYDRAVVILLSDHGEGLGDHGEKEHGILLYRENLQVPLIVKLPRQRRAGERVARPVGLVDVAPTLYELLGMEPPSGLPGASLLAPEKAVEPGRALYAETLYPRIHLGWSELRSLCDGRWQYIEGPDPELYDLAHDPQERENVLARERREYRRLADQLKEIPLALEAAAEASAEERAKLAALGYLTGAAPEPRGARLDPKLEIALLEELQEAFRLANTGALPRALTALDGILQRQPALTDARLQRAAVLRRLGRLPEAKEEYLRVARESEPHRESVALEVAKLELDLGDAVAAEKHARLALAASPAEARLVLAAAAERQGDLATAEREAREALGPVDRPHLPALVFLARIGIERGEPAAAVELLAGVRERIAAGEIASVATLEGTAGDALARLGRAAEAEAAFRREIARFPGGTEAYARLALLLASQRRFDEIRPLLDAMVAAQPGPRALLVAGQVMEDLGNRGDAAAYRARARTLGARAAGAS